MLRKDVVSVVKELDSKSLSEPIGKMYKRLEKHFASSSDDQVTYQAKQLLHKNVQFKIR